MDTNQLTNLHSQQSVLEVWKTITLGTGIKDADGFNKAFKDKEMQISDWVNDIFDKSAFTVATEKIEVNLVVVTVAELGFHKGATLKDVHEAAYKRGLQLCPAEVGPQLRLQYTDQPRGEWLVIGMEPIADSDGDLRLFRVGHRDSDEWLGSEYAYPGYIWDDYRRFVFILPN